MKQNNKKSSSAKNLKKPARGNGKASVFDWSGSKSKKIAGIPNGALATTGIAVLGAAILGATGYLVWKKRDTIMGLFDSFKDDVTERFGKERNEDESVQEPYADYSRSSDEEQSHPM